MKENPKYYQFQRPQFWTEIHSKNTWEWETSILGFSEYPANFKCFVHTSFPTLACGDDVLKFFWSSRGPTCLTEFSDRHTTLNLEAQLELYVSGISAELACV
ncbi:unnamed protein product [Allacma fusca]|uniref:Uncharacterized protein n=1 Tax=Allacma fusca TaxID=39272 RepID=A0A8J2KNR5_9HEXA|nr:unnamed protein product [Allacma fusca]